MRVLAGDSQGAAGRWSICRSPIRRRGRTPRRGRWQSSTSCRTRVQPSPCAEGEGQAVDRDHGRRHCAAELDGAAEDAGKALGEEIEADDERGEREARTEDGGRRDHQERPVLADHQPPFRRRRPEPEAEEAERADEHRRIARAQGELDQQYARGIGQELAPHDRPGRFAAEPATVTKSRVAMSIAAARAMRAMRGA